MFCFEPDPWYVTSSTRWVGIGSTFGVKSNLYYVTPSVLWFVIDPMSKVFIMYRSKFMYAFFQIIECKLGYGVLFVCVFESKFILHAFF